MGIFPCLTCTRDQNFILQFRMSERFGVFSNAWLCPLFAFSEVCECWSRFCTNTSENPALNNCKQYKLSMQPVTQMSSFSQVPLRHLLTVISSSEQYWSMSFLWDYERLLEECNNLLTKQNWSCLFSLRGKRNMFFPRHESGFGKGINEQSSRTGHLASSWKTLKIQAK